MKTISEILLTCEVNDELKDQTGNFWTVKDRYEENNKTVVIATPKDNNKKDYELWSVGLEEDVSMTGLMKI